MKIKYLRLLDSAFEKRQSGSGFSATISGIGDLPVTQLKGMSAQYVLVMFSSGVSHDTRRKVVDEVRRQSRGVILRLSFYHNLCKP